MPSHVISQKGLEFIANEEGFVERIYLDQVGKKTIGYGHLVAPGSLWPNGITKWQALQLLRSDAAAAEAAVNAAVLVPLTQNQFDALVSLVFNLGPNQVMNPKTSTLLRLLNAGEYGSEPTYDSPAKPLKKLDVKPGAAGQFAVWRMGAGAPLPVLVGRRAREARVFLSPDDGVFLAG